MIGMVAFSFFFSSLAILIVAGAAITYTIENKSNKERLAHLEQESAWRAAVAGHSAVKRSLEDMHKETTNEH